MKHTAQQRSGGIPSSAVANTIGRTKGVSMPAVKPNIVLQAKWVEDGENKWKENALIDGVQWYKDAQEKLWYTIVDPSRITQGSFEAYQRWAGQRFTHEQWDQIELISTRRAAPADSEFVDEHYLYKGVGGPRLGEDFKEPYLPIGIRAGSATMIAKAMTGREPTKLDAITLWFGSMDKAKDYCTSHHGFILLRIDVSGHPVAKNESGEYFTTMPVEWSKVSYLNDDDEWVAIVVGTVPGDPKDFDD